MQAQCDPLIRLDFKWIYSVLFYRCESLTSMTVGHNTQSREEQIGLSRLLSHVAVQSVQQIKWRSELYLENKTLKAIQPNYLIHRQTRTILGSIQFKAQLKLAATQILHMATCLLIPKY